MKYKEFRSWCNNRACDGCWSSKTAIYCLGIIEILEAIPFWKRENVWHQEYEEEIVEKVIKVIEAKRKEAGYID